MITDMAGGTADEEGGPSQEAGKHHAGLYTERAGGWPLHQQSVVWIGTVWQLLNHPCLQGHCNLCPTKVDQRLQTRAMRIIVKDNTYTLSTEDLLEATELLSVHHICHLVTLQFALWSLLEEEVQTECL